MRQPGHKLQLNRTIASPHPPNKNIRITSIALALPAPIAFSFGPKSESIGPDPDVILKNLYKTHAAQRGPSDDKDNLKVLAPIAFSFFHASVFRVPQTSF